MALEDLTTPTDIGVRIVNVVMKAAELMGVLPFSMKNDRLSESIIGKMLDAVFSSIMLERCVEICTRTSSLSSSSWLLRRLARRILCKRPLCFYSYA